MPDHDILALAAPISEDEPCGPDLEELGDPEYWQFTGAIETDLPTTFDGFFESRRTPVDYSDRIKACYELLERTRDLRLIVWLAKLSLLGRDLTGFVDSIQLMGKLIDEQWDGVHPLPFEDDLTMRMVTLERLDERASIELPLQYIRLIEDQTGPVAFRDHLVAEGEVQPREGERFRSGDDLRKTLARCDVELIIAARDKIDGARSTLSTIRNTWLEKAGFDQVMQLERLPNLLDRMFSYLDDAVAQRRPDLAEGTGETAGEGEGDGTEGGTDGGTVASGPVLPRGTIKTPRDVVKALRAVSTYFETYEPSSPARLLVKQSEQLVGRSWIDVVSILLPNSFDSAFIAVEGTSPFRLPLVSLSDRLQIGQGYDEPPTYEDEENSGYESYDYDTPTYDDSGPGGSSDWGEDGGAGLGGADSLAAQGAAPTFEVHRRGDAGTLLADVVTYYRTVEPSSPLPALLDRAQNLMARDFTTIIKEFLDEES